MIRCQQGGQFAFLLLQIARRKGRSAIAAPAARS